MIPEDLNILAACLAIAQGLIFRAENCVGGYACRRLFALDSLNGMPL